MRGKTTGNHSAWLRRWLSVAGLLCAFAAHGAGPETFIMGTDADETTHTWKWYSRIYGEAFRRMGIPLTMAVAPTLRLTAIADQGEVHGQGSRVFGYADAHPTQVRVPESVHEVRLSLYAFGPVTAANSPKRLGDLTEGRAMVEYRRGVAICEQTLKPLLSPERLSDVTNIEQGLKKLKSGRTDLYCDFDLAVRNVLLTPAMKGESGFRQAIDLGVGLPLYPYVHVSRAELAPRLAETLKKMKAEGLIERYYQEAEREVGAAR